MGLTLQRFLAGDTNYVAKHNSNADVLEAALASLTANLQGGFSGAISIGAALQALLGSSTALIGSASYVPTVSGSNLVISAGYAWRADLGLVVASAGSATLAFAGVAAGTYYLVPDSTGVPTRTTNAVGAVYAVVWSGSAFGAITRNAPVLWGAADQIAAQSSTALAATYLSLDARLEAGEAKAVTGDLARTAQTGKLTRSVAGGANVILTAAETGNAVIEMTGALTADITVTLAGSGPRTWLLVNSTTGGKTLTARVGSGTGASVKVPPGASFVYFSGADLYSAGFRPYRPAVIALAYGPALAADFAQADTVRATLFGNPTITLAGASDGQRCVLELTQDSSGGRTPIFGSQIRLGSDLAALVLSSAAGKTDRMGFIYDAAAGKYDLVALMKGY